MKYPVSRDRIVGDGGNCTVYERPDGSWYALDRYGRGSELPQRTRIAGPAKFDSRPDVKLTWGGVPVDPVKPWLDDYPSTNPEEGTKR